MKINKIFPIAGMLTMLLLGHTACDESKILEQTNPNAPAASTFWQTADDAKKGIMGAYAPFTDIWYYTRFEVFVSDYRDDLVNGYGTSERTAAGQFAGVPESNAAFWVWAAMFKGVSRANDVLANVPDIDMDQSAKDNILGEAYFIRAFNYFNLVNTWLNVPLIIVPAGEILNTREVPQADPAVVWEQIEKDLLEAQKLLPSDWSETDKGRVTNMGATAMLGKAYLYQKKYDEAKVEFEKILDPASGYGLEADYRDNFREASENNKESLFEIQLLADGNQGWCADCASHGTGAAFHQDLAPQSYTGQDGMRINQWALDLFLDETTINGEIDPRAFTTLFWNTTETTTYQGDVLQSATYEGTSFQDAYGATDQRIFASKHLDFEQGYSAASIGWHFSGNNLRLIRYADILLMYAEAEFELNGSTQVALDAINEVRARVDMPAFTTLTMQDIRDERVKELSLERSRYYDLLRWGLVKSRIADNSSIKSESGGTGAYQPGREYMAIPSIELDNSDVFTQNPGYNN
ncbi:RagB/SusD family nutrient uptake outer membrane protein [Reichenbachiella sp. MSK19-1]|uniref:RagB/SusD family nutrient uptake outer membrane protein n=1 Tax=Reichenbachiella sp. MSK19-1 TaxID=1897631 RepID=UPI000EE11A62|nr:RagB/SusD family nutrient uptake outer membrane protein [Reichenbachiella sp. MSK19-1]RJE72519.1 carbohydrate-binding protein SusD [Reichenbachiella sp. MSK19-1]